MADLGFNKSYIAEYDVLTGVISLIFESVDFDQSVHIRELNQPIGDVASLSPNEAGWIVETEDAFTFIGNVQGQDAVLVQIDNGPGVDPDYYVYSVTNLNLDPVSYQLDNTVTSYIYCLLEGTLIPTLNGEIPVEDLSAEDLVLDSFGKYVPVRWVGVQSIDLDVLNPAALPVKISKDAFGVDLPNQDLYVSQDHVISIDDLLISAGCLLNGTSVEIFTPNSSRIRYFGIDLGKATLHLVHGLKVGSLGAVPREYFDNFAEWQASYLEFVDEPLMHPRIKHSSQLPPRIAQMDYAN